MVENEYMVVAEDSDLLDSFTTEVLPKVAPPVNRYLAMSQVAGSLNLI